MDFTAKAPNTYHGVSIPLAGLHDLTPNQRRAAEHIDGPLLVLAGPGSGKTRVITQRIACMVNRGINPRNILAITFTNKAAGEMAERVGKLLPGCRVWVGRSGVPAESPRGVGRSRRPVAYAISLKPFSVPAALLSAVLS